jgi:bidirectional [NiFe] hydrogenase diaphorase subunit
MAITLTRPPAPNADKRWKILDATMRRHGYAGHALIESLHQAQESFGFLDETTMKYVAGSLHLPLSKVYGVATFYHFFSLKPQGEHTCVVCLGTACYIKGAPQITEALTQRFGVALGKTTADNTLSVLPARCIGACALAPATVIDGEVFGRTDPHAVVSKVEQALAGGGRKVEHAA